MSTDLAVRPEASVEFFAADPDQVIAKAERCASVLKDVIVK